MDTINVVVPSTVMIALKHHDADLTIDLNGKSVEWISWAIAMGVRQSAGDADAGKGDLSDNARKQLVRAKFDKIASGEIPVGGGGGGKRISDTEQARRNVMAALYMKQGLAKGLAEKRAAKDGWNEYFLSALSKKENRTNVTMDEAIAAYDANAEAIAKMVDAEIAAIVAERDRQKDLAKDLEIVI